MKYCVVAVLQRHYEVLPYADSDDDDDYDHNYNNNDDVKFAI